MKIIVFNCGSSSIKYKLFEMPAETLLAEGLIQRIGQQNAQASQKSERGSLQLDEAIPDYTRGFELLAAMLTDPEHGMLTALSDVEAAGHRVVHGGEGYTGSVPVDAELEKGIEACFDLAPLHNPPNLMGIRTAGSFFGDIPQIACFDTAFHQTLPNKAYLYALPMELYRSHRIRRYGFHGISHRYVARRYAELVGRDKHDVDVITCHLGNGSSLCAIHKGKAVDTSMGLTPLEGLVMGTRSGDLDPEIVLFLQRHGRSIDEVSKLLNKRSGLLGLSGLSNDVRDLEGQAAAGNADAELALEIFAYRVRKYIGSYLAVLNGADAIIFTGGIGERGSLMRSRILSGMERLGIRMDAARNQELNGIEGAFQQADSPTDLYVIPTNEELAIARDTYRMSTGQ